MTKSKMAIVIFLISAFSLSANAAFITVNYQALNTGYTDLSGTFSGDDLNNDGWLTFSELDDWNTAYSGGYTFTSLNDLGDFDYLNNLWTPNALQWDGTTEDAYMTWNNWTMSASTSNYDWNFTTTVTDAPSAVPVPAAAWLFGSALLGFFGFSRKKANT